MKIDDVELVKCAARCSVLVMPMRTNDGTPHVHVDASDDEEDRCVTLGLSITEARRIGEILIAASLAFEGAKS